MQSQDQLMSQLEDQFLDCEPNDQRPEESEELVPPKLYDFNHVPNEPRSNYLIEVTNESGLKSILETGISKLIKEVYLEDHLSYLKECNPTKSFKLV